MPKPMNIREIERVNKLEAQQRAMEREVRKAKRKAAGCTDPEAIKEAKAEVKARQEELRKFVEKHGDVLRRDYWRERDDGVRMDRKEDRGIASNASSAQSDSDHIEFVSAESRSEAQRFVQNVLGLEKIDAYGSGINVDVANGVNEAIFKISSDFGSVSEYGYLTGVEISKVEEGPYAAYSRKKRLILLNKVVTQDNAMDMLAQDASEQFKLGGWSSPSPMHSVYHELGHAVQHMYLDKNTGLREKIKLLYDKTYCDILGSDAEWVTDQNVIAEYGNRAKAAGFSYYGLRSLGDFVAEAIAQYYCLEPPGSIAMDAIEMLLKG